MLQLVKIAHNTFRRVDVCRVGVHCLWNGPLVYPTVDDHANELMITRTKFTAFLRSVWIIGDEVRLFQLATVAHMILLGKWILVEFFGLCDYWSILLVFGSVSILKSAKEVTTTLAIPRWSPTPVLSKPTQG